MALEVSAVSDLILAIVYSGETRLWDVGQLLQLVLAQVDRLEELEVRRELLQELHRLNLVLRAIDRLQVWEINEALDVANVVLLQVNVLEVVVIGQVAKTIF